VSHASRTTPHEARVVGEPPAVGPTPTRGGGEGEREREREGGGEGERERRGRGGEGGRGGRAEGREGRGPPAGRGRGRGGPMSSSRTVLQVFEQYQKNRVAFVQTVAELATRPQVRSRVLRARPALARARVPLSPPPPPPPRAALPAPPPLRALRRPRPPWACLVPWPPGGAGCGSRGRARRDLVRMIEAPRRRCPWGPLPCVLRPRAPARPARCPPEGAPSSGGPPAP